MGLISWLDRSWFSCRRFTERASKACDIPLTGSDKAGYVFHYYFCFYCRRFNGQLGKLQEYFRRYSEHLNNGTIEPLPDETLSEQTRTNILSEINNYKK